MNKNFKRLAAGVLLSFAPLAAIASCDSYWSSYNSASTQQDKDTYYAYLVENGCIGAGSSGSSSGAVQQLQATTAQQVGIVSNVIGSRLLSAGPQGSGPGQLGAAGVKGLSAGAASSTWNAWGSLSSSDSRYDPGNNNKRGADVVNTIVGADYGIAPNMIGGVSLAFDRGDGSVSRAATRVTTSGYSIAPYIGMQINQNLALDAAFGFGSGKTGQGGGIESEADRQFFAVNASYAKWFDAWQVTGKAGYLDAVEKYSDTRRNGAVQTGTGFKNKISQLRIGADVGYWMNGVMPFVGLAYTQDLRLVTSIKDPNWDKDAFILTAGFNFFSLTNKMTGGITYTDETGRRHARNSTLMGNLNIRF